MAKKSSATNKTKAQLLHEPEQLQEKVEEVEEKDAQRKYYCEELEKSETRLKETERIANIGSWEMDIATGKSLWSEGFYRICGLDPADVEPSAETGMQIIHKDDRERAAKAVQEAIDTHGEYNIEKRIVRPDGEVRTVISRGEIITDENDNPIKLVGAFMDVTLQKEAEAEIRQLNEELEQRVIERTKELEKANNELQRISTTDALTGIYNRRFFNETIENEWRRAIRKKEAVSLIMVDIDYFKAYNDHYGHLEGDECLRKVAGALNGAVKRSGDILARYGGEEFVVLLPGTDTSGALQVAMTMQYNIAMLKLSHCKSRVGELLTVSMGLSTAAPEMDSKYTKIIQKADEALYAAKKEGRNQIIIN